jgi:hypothetical protein
VKAHAEVCGPAQAQHAQRNRSSQVLQQESCVARISTGQNPNEWKKHSQSNQLQQKATGIDASWHRTVVIVQGG